MTATGDPAERLNAARATGRQIADLIEETRLVAWWQDAAQGRDGPGGELSQFRLKVLNLVLTQGVQMGDSPDERSWLAEARTAGHQIAELIRDRDRPWWKDRNTGPALLLCLRLAEYLASAKCRDEADQFIKLLTQTVRGGSPALDPPGNYGQLWGPISRHTQRLTQVAIDNAAARLEVAQTIGRQIVNTWPWSTCHRRTWCKSGRRATTTPARPCGTCCGWRSASCPCRSRPGTPRSSAPRSGTCAISHPAAASRTPSGWPAGPGGYAPTSVRRAPRYGPCHPRADCCPANTAVQPRRGPMVLTTG
jgi:hypothetical protein